MNFHRILPHLYLGSLPQTADDARTLARHGVTHVLNVASDCVGKDAPVLVPGTAYALCAADDDGNPKPDAWIAECVDRGLSALRHGTLYVHCRMGWTRSPSIVYALLRGMGWDSDRSVRHIHAQRPIPQLCIRYKADVDRYFSRRVKVERYAFG